MLRCPEQTDQRLVFPGRRPDGGRLRMLSIGERHAWAQTDWQTNDVAIQVSKKQAEKCKFNLWQYKNKKWEI
jgi:hypothetical protein